MIKGTAATSSAASAAVDSAAGVLDPNAKLTRTQMAVLLNNSLIAVGKYPQMSDVVKKSLDAFADKVAGNDDWAAVAYMGLIRGKSDEKGKSYLAVSDFVTRVQMAIVLERLLQLK
ncbi:hypothetical protein M5X11_39290 [Paenibacillus alginolyticus]|uniref:SLH domain-containing protein n=1 Tax=Paenibacillus alginolyticus TaxID=59839 RepID=A0ABT4GR53_9BACL|nr:hypothetical protein [Paenibacillus alginolyticus]MCY9670865.1 hypothetical protein [Paenibacillus alginolyticus]MCY9698469.1 hypothetical protein [Paenibacillus alginolyticus]MEC0148465.1 hypothetical protein [Paenibacillus alginolyticus]